MERHVLLEGSKVQIRFIVDPNDHMTDDQVASLLRVKLQQSRDAGRDVPQWLEDKAVAYAVKYHRQRLGQEKPTAAALAKPHWLVKFTRRGMEPPLPFGHTSEVVCALSRQDAVEQVPASPRYPVTATRTDQPVTFTHHCSCAQRPDAGVSKLAAEVGSMLKG
jgi:hypothetical protein